jgi:archaellum component FlaC
MENIEELKEYIKNLELQLRTSDKALNKLLDNKVELEKKIEELESDYDYVIDEGIDFRAKYILFLELITKINISNRDNLPFIDISSLASIVNKYLDNYKVDLIKVS